MYYVLYKHISEEDIFVRLIWCFYCFSLFKVCLVYSPGEIGVWVFFVVIGCFYCFLFEFFCFPREITDRKQISL